MQKSSIHLTPFLCVSALFLLGAGASGLARAELTAEHKVRVRGEMREIWSKMTPEERELLRREDGAPRAEPEKVVEAQKSISSTPSVQQPNAGNQRPAGDRQRLLSQEDHHHLRRQLKDIVVETKP